MKTFVKSNSFKVIVLALMPIVCCVIYCLLQGKTILDVYLPDSPWNDELFYFKQVEGILEYGYPQGYFGFNESHALKLSFAAWSPVLVWPWVLWGLLFGWNFMSPIYCNIVLMTAAMILFGYFVKPSWKQLGVLLCLFPLYTPFVRYMLSGMPEVICFSMLIIFYSIAICYLRTEKIALLIVLFALAALMTLMRPYLLLFMFLPFVLAIKKYRWKGLLVSIVVFAVSLCGYGAIKHFLGAEYFAPLFFTDWITAFFEQGLIGGLKYFCSKLYWNGLDFLDHIRNGISGGLASGSFFSGYIVILLVLCIQTICDAIKIKKNKRKESAKKDSERELGNLLIVEAHLAFSFVGMLFALLLMYKLTEGSKHLLTFMAAAIFVICLMRTKYFEKAIVIGVTFVCFYIIMAVDPYDYQVPFQTQENVAQVEYWEEVYDSSIELVTENVPNYENDVIWVFYDHITDADTLTETSVGLKWQLLYGLPKGMGISCCMPDYVISSIDDLKSKYVATVNGGKIDILCQEKGFVEIARDSDMVLYARY